MELIEPKAKKGCKLTSNASLPVIFKKDGSLYTFKAYFNGFCVVIEEEEDMKNVVSLGNFGKANFSRSYPQFGNKIEIIRARQYKRRKEWGERLSDKKNLKKVIVIPDSDEENEENEDYFTNLEPKYQIDSSGLKESVWLSLEEAFFLTSAVNCLEIQYENRILQPQEIWSLFSETDSRFVSNYITYYYFRTKNWVVKPGIKFGGDFLLYKQGPAFYHASYVVIIDVVNEDSERIEMFSRRCMDNVSLLSLYRLCETAGKELLIFQILWPKNLKIDFNDLSNFSIKEILMRRWISTQERNTENSLNNL